MNDTPVPKVYAAIAAVQKAMAHEGIGKSRQNTDQKYKFRGIDDVYNALAGHLAEAKLCILPRMLTREMMERTSRSGGILSYVTVEAEFDFVSCEDASKHTCKLFGEAMDSSDKATNKAMSAAYKYLCMQSFCIPTEGDNDADATTHEAQAKTNGATAKPAPPTQAARPQAPIITDADVQAIREVLVAKNVPEGDAAYWVSSHRTRVLCELTGPEGVRLFNQYKG